MNVERKKYPDIDQASEAVADAMMITHTQLLKHALYGIGSEKFENLTTEELDGKLSSSSHRMCEHASSYALFFLTNRYGHLFNRFAMLKGYEEINLERSAFFTMDHWYNFAFVVQDNKKVWYAGSPANDKLYSEASALTTIYRDTSIEATLDKLKKDYSFWQWPSAPFIEQTMQDNYTQPKIIIPKSRPILRVLEIQPDSAAYRDFTVFQYYDRVGY